MGLVERSIAQVASASHRDSGHNVVTHGRRRGDGSKRFDMSRRNGDLVTRVKNYSNEPSGSFTDTALLPTDRLGNINLPHLLPLKYLSRRGIPHLCTTHLPSEQQPALQLALKVLEARAAVDAAIGQDDGVALDAALGVVGVGHGAGELVELG